MGVEGVVREVPEARTLEVLAVSFCARMRSSAERSKRPTRPAASVSSQLTEFRRMETGATMRAGGREAAVPPPLPTAPPLPVLVELPELMVETQTTPPVQPTLALPEAATRRTRTSGSPAMPGMMARGSSVREVEEGEEVMGLLSSLRTTGLWNSTELQAERARVESEARRVRRERVKGAV